MLLDQSVGWHGLWHLRNDPLARFVAELKLPVFSHGRMSGEAVKVAVRCRPLNSAERNAGERKIVEVDSQRAEVVLHNPESSLKDKPRCFTYDQAFDDNSEQASVFQATTRPILDACIEGFNGT